jgi:predicted CXXCH cytochrome family protein
MAEELGESMRFAVNFFAIAGFILPAFLCSCNPSSTETGSGQFDESNPMGANAACYVCHIPFVQEEISKAHLRAKVPCTRCHGLSAGHANDEDIGATPPDIIFERDQVDAMCLKCHQRHDITDEMTAKYKTGPVCTDCHGNHKIKKL